MKRDTRRNARWVIAGGATLFGTLIALIAITHRTIWLDKAVSSA